jgi:peptide subunit release factor 1 (eRF1)
VRPAAPARAGGENGFNQAIELSSEMLSNVKFVQEKRLIGKFFEEISQDSGERLGSPTQQPHATGWREMGAGRSASRMAHRG